MYLLNWSDWKGKSKKLIIRARSGIERPKELKRNQLMLGQNTKKNTYIEVKTASTEKECGAHSFNNSK